MKKYILHLTLLACLTVMISCNGRTGSGAGSMSGKSVTDSTPAWTLADVPVAPAGKGSMILAEWEKGVGPAGILQDILLRQAR